MLNVWSQECETQTRPQLKPWICIILKNTVVMVGLAQSNHAISISKRPKWLKWSNGQIKRAFAQYKRPTYSSSQCRIKRIALSIHPSQSQHRYYTTPSTKRFTLKAPFSMGDLAIQIKAQNRAVKWNVWASEFYKSQTLFSIF